MEGTTSFNFNFIESFNKRFERFILASLVLHLFLVLLVTKLNDKSLSDANKQTEISVDIVTLPPSIETKKKKQIVQTEIVNPTKETTEEAFLGEKTQKVERQTKASVVDKFRAAKQGSAAGEKTAKQQSEDALSLSKIAFKNNLSPMGHLNPEQQESAILGSNNDHIRNVKDGAQTLLNTREYAYFSFYQRVRRQLEQFWEPGLRVNIRKMINRGRSLASEREHITKLLVVLNTLGHITKIQVKDTSGVLDLDQAAIEAFNKAGPFPNPPKGLIESDGTVSVEWEFVLKT